MLTSSYKNDCQQLLACRTSLRNKHHLLEDIKENENYNNSQTLSIVQELRKSAVDLTTARFRMLVNSEDFARPFEAKVDNNLPEERYSSIDMLIHFSEIAYGGLTDDIVKQLIDGRRLFRRLYFSETYCRYFDKIMTNSPLLMYRLNTNPKPGIWIDKIVQWYPIFTGQATEKLASINQEKLSFKQHLKLEFREILLDYYEMTGHFPHGLVSGLVESVESHIGSIVDRCLVPFELSNEICKKCGESFQNKDDLINHHDFNGCKLSPVHRCQCGDIFMSHGEWHSHSINVSMDCAPFAWHLWRHKRSVSSYSYMCDGCQHLFSGFVRFWHHICFCPFFVAFLIGNCPLCTAQTRLDVYQMPDTQALISRPHADKVGIAIVRDWARITKIKFNIKLAIPEEPRL